MTSRPSLVRSIPFWVLLAGSLVLTAIGAWLVVDRLGRIESAIVSQSAEAGIEVYVGQPAVLAGGVLLGAGLVGLLLSLTVAALSTLRPVPAAEIEAIDWTEDEVAAPAPQYSASAAAAPAASAAPAAAPAPATHADPVIAEDPDVETPSTATPPSNARD